MIKGDKVILERNCKHPEEYTVILRLSGDIHLVTRDKDEKPKLVYLAEIQQPELMKEVP